MSVIIEKTGVFKICYKCKQKKLINFFNKSKDKKDGLSSYCLECHNKRSHLYYLQNQNKIKQRSEKYNQTENAKRCHRNYYLKSHYGLTLKEYDLKRKEQNYCCAICGISELLLSRKLDVDHDHFGGKTRKLLCNLCNQGLGLFKHNKKFLKRAIDYLKEY